MFSDPLAEGRGQVKILTFNLTNMRSTFNFKLRNSIWPRAYGELLICDPFVSTYEALNADG